MTEWLGRFDQHSRSAKLRRIFNERRQALLQSELGPDSRHFQEGFAN
jgi:hypothetical protein